MRPLLGAQWKYGIDTAPVIDRAVGAIQCRDLADRRLPGPSEPL